jgi:NTE family protein
MDAGPIPPPHDHPWRPARCDTVGLVLQGGGALGAYQAGVYQGLHETGLEPDWLAGVSIGSINAALIAGNAPEDRVAALQDFWKTVTMRPVWGFRPQSDDLRKMHNLWSSAMTLSQGQPGFFTPNIPSPWLRPRGDAGATSYYDNTPLRETLLRLVDFDRINHGPIRFAVGAVDVATGNFAYFDNADTTILPEHVIASGALPPAMPMTQIGGDFYWDGGIVSNTPLQHLLDCINAEGALVFQVDLFSARGAIPRDMAEVYARSKDIQYSSRTRLTTDYYRKFHAQRLQMKHLLAKLPETLLSEEERALKAKLANLPAISILQMIYQEAAHEGQAKDYDFSRSSMRDHWAAGLRDTEKTMARRDWLEIPTEESGIVSRDIHRA